jgi:hypothetical protein
MAEGTGLGLPRVGRNHTPKPRTPWANSTRVKVWEFLQARPSAAGGDFPLAQLSRNLADLRLVLPCPKNHPMHDLTKGLAPQLLDRPADES